MKFLILGFVALFSFPLFATNNEVRHQDPPPRGLYVGLTTGQMYFTGRQDRQNFGDSWLVGVRAGYDLMKYISLEGQVRFSAHDTAFNVGNTQSIPTSFLAFQGLSLVRVFLPVTRRVSVFADLGGGFWYTDPNQKPTVRGSFRAMGAAGLGVQYFLRIRGLAMGLDPQVNVIQDFEGPAFQLTGYLRYTF